jgi:hypothetical protein
MTHGWNRARHLHWPAAWILAALFCACGGGGGGATSEPLAHDEAALSTSCARAPLDPAQVVAILDHENDGGLPPSCDVDDQCPCGMFCHPDGFCDAECVPGDAYYRCDDPARPVCNDLGKCVATNGGGTPVTTLPIVTVTPQVVTLPAPGWPSTASNVTVTLTTDDPTVASTGARQPSILVRGSLTGEPQCDPADPTACHMSFTTDLEVSCSPGAAFADECTLRPPYSFSGTAPNLSATRTIQVRARSGAPADAWELRFFGDGASGLPTRISVVPAGGVVTPFTGLYEGTASLATAGSPLAVRLPVRAYATTGKVLLVDATRVIAPSGKLRLPLTGDPQRVPWLVSGSTTEVVAEVAPVGLTYDPASGQIQGGFSVTLPGLVPGHPARPLLWHLTLARREDLVAPTCSSTSPSCTDGSACDLELGRCIPGEAFVASTVAAPTNAIVDPGLHGWDSQVANIASGVWTAARPTPDGVERLLCENGARFGNVILPLSGELACSANGGSTVVPGAVRLALLKDSGIGLSLEDTYKKCLAQLSDTTQTASPRECVALWRFHPSLLMLLDTALGTDARGARLLQMGLRQWASAHAFLAGQAVELARLGSAMIGSSTTVDVSALLDRVGAGLKLYLDGELASGLDRLDPDTLRNPDYRYSNRPWSYWANGGGAQTTMNDVESTRILRASSDYAYTTWIAPAENPFAGDFTVTWRDNFDLFKPGPLEQWKTMDMGVDYTLSGGTFYERGYRRNDYNPSSTSFYERDGYSWYTCLESCISSQYCLAWSWRPAQGGKQQRCSMHTTLTGPYGDRRAVSDGSISGLVRYGYDDPPCTGTSCGPGDVLPGTDFSGPDSTASPTTSQATCQSWCNGNASCLAWTFTGSSCRMKYGPLPLPTSRAGYTSGYSPRGHKISSVIADKLQNGTTYFGAALESFSAANWDACHQRCMDRSDCNMWSFGKTTRTCTLRATGRVLPVLNGNDVVSGVKPLIGMELRRRTSYGHFERFFFPLTDMTRNLVHGAAYTLVHKAEEHRYILYMDGQYAAERSYTTEPAAPRPDYDQLEVARNATDMTTRQVTDLAIFATALDDREIGAIQQRRQAQQVNPVTGNTFRQAIPTSPDHDEARGLPVAMLETLEAELGLLGQLVDARAGAVAAECRTSNQPVRTELLARTGATLRRGLAGEAVAAELDARASRIACRTDVNCAAAHGVCGPPRTKITVPVWDMSQATLRGTMRQCLAFWDAEGSAVCGQQGSGSGNDGASSPGSATYSFTVPAAGTFSLWGRAATRDGSSFFVSVDNGPWEYWGLAWRANMDNPSWSWQRFTSTYTLGQGSHTVALAVADDGTMMRELLFTTATGDASPSQTDDVCYDAATGAPIVSAPPWQGDYQKASSALAAARASLGESIAAVSTCKNPLGIEDEDLPLYFKDVLGDVSRYFAASDFLFTEAEAALGRANPALANAQSAWLAEKNAQYQSQLDDQQRADRMNALETSYESPLTDLCGVYVTNAGDLLDSFASGSITTTLCFVQPGPYCAGNANASVENADDTCYRGQLGETLLSMKSAWLRLTAAQQIYDSKQADVERSANVCAMRQDMQADIEKHYRLMRQLREERKAIGLIGAMFKGVIMLGTAGMSAQAGGVTDAQGLDAFSTITSLGFNLWGAHVQSKIDDEEFAFKELMEVGEGKIQLQECLNAVAAKRDGLVTARLDIASATNDFQQAAMRFANLRRKTEQLVAQGLADRARDASRTVPRPQHYPWLDDAVTNYRRELTWTRRIMYLALRAVEYDTQQSLDLRALILDAQNPTQLATALQRLREARPPRVAGKTPSQMFFVVRVGADLLGFDGTDGKAKLRSFVTSPAQTITDRAGHVVGQGLRFFLTPEVASALMDIPLENRCGERVWTVSAQVHTSQSQRPSVATVRIYKRNTFSSQWCVAQPDGSERQVASIRPWNNLFRPSTSSMPLAAQPVTTAADLQAAVNGRVEDMVAPVYDRGAVEDFAARGLYGEYVVVFPKDTLVDLKQLDEVYLRFDYLSVPAGPDLP